MFFDNKKNIALLEKEIQKGLPRFLLRFVFISLVGSFFCILPYAYTKRGTEDIGMYYGKWLGIAVIVGIFLGIFIGYLLWKRIHVERKKFYDPDYKAEIQKNQMSTKTSKRWDKFFDFLTTAYAFLGFGAYFTRLKVEGDIFAQVFIGSIVTYLGLYFSFKLYRFTQLIKGNKHHYTSKMISLFSSLGVLTAICLLAMWMRSEGYFQ